MEKCIQLFHLIDVLFSLTWQTHFNIMELHIQFRNDLLFGNQRILKDDIWIYIITVSTAINTKNYTIKIP